MKGLVKLFTWLCCCSFISCNDAIDTTDTTQDVRIGAFNIRRLGKKKFNDAFVIDHLLKIISRYDLLLAQEVQNKDKKRIHEFVQKLNEYSGNPYEYVCSDYLGRKTYKEQYLYIYRSDIFQIADKYHYDDGSEELGEDTFQREPYIILVKSAKIAVGKMAIVGAHLTPSAVEEELNELVNVHDNVINKWGELPVVMMGDFNAGGGHISKTKMKNLILRKDDRFHWLVENEDTTVGKNEYTYDRIIVTGDELVTSILPNSAKAFNFEEEYGLTKEEAGRISDHYPVEFVIGKVDKDEL